MVQMTMQCCAVLIVDDVVSHWPSFNFFSEIPTFPCPVEMVGEVFILVVCVLCFSVIMFLFVNKLMGKCVTPSVVKFQN